MSRYSNVELTNMCMVMNKDGKVLVQDKIGDSSWCGLTFPGGHIENNESLVDSVIREVFEETGLKIENPVLCGSKDWINKDGSRYVVLFYRTNIFTGIIRPSLEGNVQWMTLEEMKKEKMVEHMDQMIEVFVHDDLSEFYYQRTESGYKIELK